MKITKKTGAAALCAAAIAALTTASGYAYATYAKWGSNQVMFYINPSNGDIDATSAENGVVAGMNAWNTAGTPFRFSYAGRVNDTNTGYDSKNVVVFRNASNGSAIATTYSWWSGSTLVDADIIFWDAAFTFTAGDLGCAGAAYIEDVATHELGHALGLSHSGAADATMYPSYSMCSQEMRSLAADDIAGVQNLYGTAHAPTNTAPSVSITSPTSSSFPAGATVQFGGSATDTQDGNLTAQMVWTSNLVGQIGSGGSFSVVLPAGTHAITATATDSGGLTTSRQTTVTVTSSVNTAPAVTISSPTASTVNEGATISFAGSASDTQDGSLTSQMVWTSNLVGQIGVGGSFSRTLSAGSHVITATVTDSGGLTSSSQRTLYVAPVTTSGVLPTLNGSGYKVRKAEKADLTWSGFATSTVDIYRNGSKVTSTSNDGFFTDSPKGNSSSFKYKACGAGTTTCSNEVTVTF